MAYVPECEKYDHQYGDDAFKDDGFDVFYAESDACYKCGKLTPDANRQRLFTKKILGMLRHPERLDRVPAPPDYSTPEKISARAREGAGSHPLPSENLYAKFRKAVEAAGGTLEARNWPIKIDAVRPQAMKSSSRRRAGRVAA